MADQPDKKKQQIEKISQRVNKDYTRRDFLKTAGTAATLGAASAFGISNFMTRESGNSLLNSQNPSRSANPTGMATGSAETIQANGQSIRIDSGETWENKIIDFGNRNNITISAKGTNWTIRNIGFKGTIPYNETIFGVADSEGGTSTMENIYFGEATGEQPASERSICIWTDPDHSGTMNVRNVNFNVPGNNGIYGSAPAYNGDGGTIHLENCYGNDNHHTSFRIGDCGMSIRNCVSYKSGTRAANRGIWVWEGNYSGGATIENTHLITNGTGGGLVEHDNPDITMNQVYTDDGSGTHSNPENFVPEGCPTSAEEAVNGEGSSGGTGGTTGSSGGSTGGTSGESTLEVVGTSSGESEYAFVVDTDNVDTSGLESADSVEQVQQGHHIQGTINNGTDTYTFDGEILAMDFSGLDNARLNGQNIWAGDYPSTNEVLDGGAGGTSGGSSGGTSGGTGSTGGQDYETVEASGQTIYLDDGESYENKLIDLTTGNDFLIMVRGSDTTIRNIGFKGLYRGGDFMISIGSNATNGSVHIENVYAGDGTTKEGTDFVHGPGFLFYHGASGCDITIERCNVQGWTNNGFYCSNTAKGGSVHFKNCYGKNNGVSTYRCASPDDIIENCVAHNDNTDYGGSYDTGWTEANGRPVWVWEPGGVTIRDSNFAAGTYVGAVFAYSGANVNFESGAYEGSTNGPINTSSQVGNNPDLTPPEGVPMTAEQAASGGGTGSGSSGSTGGSTGGTSGGSTSGTTGGSSGSGGSNQPQENTLTISSDSGSAKYLIKANGQVEKENPSSGDTIFTNTATGEVSSGEEDTYTFRGDLADFQAEENISIEYNGNEMSLDEIQQLCEN